MIYVKESARSSLTKDQKELEKKGFKILDIVIVHDGYFNGVNFSLNIPKTPKTKKKVRIMNGEKQTAINWLNIKDETPKQGDEVIIKVGEQARIAIYGGQSPQTGEHLFYFNFQE